MKLLVTGSAGLVGSEAVDYFCAHGHEVVGIDNNMRRTIFGKLGDTGWRLHQLKAINKKYRHLDIDIRDGSRIDELFGTEIFDAVVHCAAQPSHDKSREIPGLDFEINAIATHLLLEANRRHSPEAPFIFLSTNKVYGDAPNDIALKELKTRWDYDDLQFSNGIAEDFRIDASRHTLFGAAKLSADIMVQEYGRTFDMPTCCLRGGCLSGPAHSGVELHGFLSYLARCCFEDTPYTIYGYKGKQVRDNIHSFDVVSFIDAFIGAPKKAAVYNLGGGKKNSVSVIEAIAKIEQLSGRSMRTSYDSANRAGDHICYYSDLTRMKTDYQLWSVTRSLDDIFEELVERWTIAIAD